MKTLVLTLATISLLTACAKDPAEGHTKAEVSAAQVPATTAAAAPTAVMKKFAIAPGTSSLDFVGAKITAQHEGKFSDVSGIVEMPAGEPERAKVRIEVGLASLQIEPEKLAGHLKSPDFFDVAKFPKATFESTSVAALVGGKGTHTITGNLDLHGVKKQISFPATISVAGETVTANAEFSINRKDFGIVYPGMPDDLIKDEVLLRLKVQASAQ